MNTRQPAVEGRFYPSTKQRIFDQIKEIESLGVYPDVETEPQKILGAVLPHAGHIFSGHQTVPFFKLLQKQQDFPETFIIIHPNHTGHGESLAIDDSDIWVNSVGEVPLDRELAFEMGLPCDRSAHAREHSAEVLIPFLQYYMGQHPFSIVPVCMGDQGFTNATLVSERILTAVSQTRRKVLVLASCDFSHFLSPAEGFRKDQFVLNEVLDRDMQGVESAVKSHDVSVCGYGPVMALMGYAASLNPEYRISVIARGHSGEVSQSPEVVDYISLIMYQ
jgi:AmmeMemoRadiSam system protein B